MNFLVKATVITGEGTGEVCEGFISECDLDENRWITLDLTGSLPGSVGIRTFEWKWEATALPINSPYCPIVCEPRTTTHTYYTLIAAPQAPMAEPWTDVLDYACSWAANQSTEAYVAQKVTEGIYYMEDEDGDIDYDWPLGRNIYSSGTGNRVFDLTSFLRDIQSSGSVIVNCSDVGNLFNIFSAVLGLSSYSKRIIKNVPPYYF